MTSALLSCVDLFCGAGGLSLGVSKAGFKTVFAADWDRYACETYRCNIGGHVACESISTLSAERICSDTGLLPGQFTLVCGGPPCQGFSVQRRGDQEDPRNDLVLLFARIAVALKPRFILIENVPGILGARGRKELSALYRILESAGYQRDARVLDAVQFGVPQRRRRAFIAAWDPLRVHGFEFPSPMLTSDKWCTVRDAIGDLPEPPSDYSEHPNFSNHRRVKVSRINEVRIAHVPPGGGRSDIPPELQLPCHRNANGHRHLDVYGRMDWDGPAPTITAMFDNFTRGRFAHPEQDRSITGREGARLQSFPDTFRFAGPKKDVARQIGNAVPPMLAFHLASRIRDVVAGALIETQLPLPMTETSTASAYATTSTA